MSFKNVVNNQYKDIVNKAARSFKETPLPAEGWIYTVRKALNMSAAELARRLGRSRALVSNTEKSEFGGGVSIKTMQKMAKAMNCRFVYAIVPEKNVDDLLLRQAREKAAHLVQTTGVHMALENQSLDPRQMEMEINRLSKQLLDEMPSDFWKFPSWK